MKKYPKIGIRPTIDGRQGGVRESLEDKTMNLAKAVAELISSNLKNGDGSPVECVIADSTIGRVAESAACAEKFEREGVGATITVTSCWCYGSETMDMHPHWPKAVWGFNGTERPVTAFILAPAVPLSSAKSTVPSSSPSSESSRTCTRPREPVPRSFSRICMVFDAKSSPKSKYFQPITQPSVTFTIGRSNTLVSVM